MNDPREEKNKQYLNSLAAKMVGEASEKADATIDYNIMMGYLQDPSEEEE